MDNEPMALSAPDRAALLRMVDASANRAREGLRVLEDYARFGLDDAGLSAELKSVRHGLAEAIGGLLPEALAHRDTPGDVGVALKTAGEARRADLADVLTAAGKRVGEALRSLEECLKVLAPGAWPAVERLRYQFYPVEQAIGRRVRPSRAFAGVRLYVLITESACRRGWRETAEAALRGGADALQLREKSLEGGELLRRARELGALCRRHGAVFIVNDRLDVALLSGADGVHLGQTDLPAADARRLAGSRLLIGVSTHGVEHARQALRDGADYIGVGPVYRSPTKPRDILPGLDYARQAAALPVSTVAIAGITAGNAAEVIATGVQAIAVTSAVTQADDPENAARRLKGLFPTQA